MPNDIIFGGVFERHNALPMLLCALAAGVVCGLFTDIFGVGEKFFGKNPVLSFFSDFLAVLSAYIAIFVCALNFNDGVVRWYHVVVVFIGYKAYLHMFSALVKRVLDIICSVVQKLLKLAVLLFIIPLKFLYGIAKVLLLKPLEKLLRFISYKAQKTVKNYKFTKEHKKYSRLAFSGFGLTGNVCFNEEDNIKNGKQKDRKSGGHRHIAGAGVSYNSLL